MKPGWQTRSLGDVIDRIAAVDPTKSPNTTFQYVDVSSISNETFRIEETQTLLGRDAPSRARRAIKTGDVLLATIRPTLKRIAIVPDHLDGQVCSTGYFVFRTKPLVLPKYLFYYLFTDQFQKAMEGLQTGASYPAVTDAQVRGQPIPLPPLDEQRRIVAILDEAFEAIATATANTEKNIVSAAEVYRRQLNSIFESLADKQSLGDFCSFENGDRGSNYPNKSARTATGVPFINAGHLLDTGLDMPNMDYISQERFDLLGNGKIRSGDILFCLRGSLGKVASVGDLSQGAIASSLVIVRPLQNLLPEFLLAYFNSDLCAEMIRKYANGAAQPNLSAGSLKKFEIPIPSMVDQKKIASSLRELKTGIDVLVDGGKNKISALRELRQAILRKAFFGGLISGSIDMAAE